MSRRSSHPALAARIPRRRDGGWPAAVTMFGLGALAMALGASCTFDLEEVRDRPLGAGGGGAIGGSGTTTGSSTTSGSGATGGGAGPCSPGQTNELGDCGNCGTSISTCGPDGQWGPASCEGEGICEPGIESYDDCGNCGTATSVCTDSCTWGAPGPCTSEGVCEAGTTQQASCDQCSEQTCSNQCTWSACELKPGSECEYLAGANWEYCQPGYWRFCSSACQWYPCDEIP